MRRKQPQVRRTQQGYTLLSAFFALGIFGATIVFYTRWEDRRQLMSRAAIEGEQAGQFAAGLRGFIAAAQANPSLIPGTQNGVDWLKAPSCGGIGTNPDEGYVPCTYTGGTLGQFYQTTFTYDAATNAIEARTTFMVPPHGDSARNAILFADRVAAGALEEPTTPNTGMFFNAWSNVPATATGPWAPPADPGPNSGRVVMVVNNAPSNDFWLRTDGTNRMLANLNAGGFSIENARDGRFSGDVRVDQRMQVDRGLTVNNGTADLRGGAITPDVRISSIGRLASEAIYDARVLTGATSYVVPKPNCTAVGNNPGIYVAMQGTGTVNSNGYQADSLYSARADVVDAGAVWQVVPVVQGTRFDLSMSGDEILFNKQLTQTNPADMRLLVMTRCR